MQIWKAHRFLTTAGMLLGGVADPPAARAAAPRFDRNYLRKKGPELVGSVAPLPKPAGFVSEVLPCPAGLPDTFNRASCSLRPGLRFSSFRFGPPPLTSCPGSSG